MSRPRARVLGLRCCSWLVLILTARVAIAAGADDRGTPAPAPDLSRRIAALLQTAPTQSVRCAATVVDLSSGAEVFSLNADQPFIPASNQKLFVMAAALEVLGTNFEFRTVVGLRGQDLVIVGDGDPAIGDPRLCERAGQAVTAVFRSWADELKRKGRSVIPGDLLVDESIFDTQYVHPSWERTDLQKWYAAPVGALNLHDNCIELTVTPSARMGAAAICDISPPSSIVEIVNRSTSASYGVPVVARPEPSFRFVVSGLCGASRVLEPVPVPDPVLFFADACRVALAESGVLIEGRIRRVRIRQEDGSLPDDLIVVAEHRTPIADVLGRIGKESQNLFAECLAKRLGYEHMRRTTNGSSVGSWVTAAAAVRAFMTRSQLDSAGLVFADASGLSRQNRATANQLVSVLKSMHTSPNGALFRDSLAAAGHDGSLSKRMRDLGTRMRGKTGTLRGIRALSGYVEGADGRLFAFSIVYNNIRGPSGPYKRLQDDLCRLLASSGVTSR